MKSSFVILRFFRSPFLFSMPVYGYLFIVSLCVMLPAQAFAGEYVKEYTYRAADTDSKVTCIKKAMDRVKVDALSEAGIHLESQFYANVSDSSKKVFEELTATTGGITKTKILKEKWDGYSCYVKARITVDKVKAQKTVKRIEENDEAEYEDSEHEEGIRYPNIKPYKESRNIFQKVWDNFTMKDSRSVSEIVHDRMWTSHKDELRSLEYKKKMKKQERGR